MQFRKAELHCDQACVLSTYLQETRIGRYPKIILAINLITGRIMEKKVRRVEVADLDAVAYSEEGLVLFIDSEDENLPATLCVQANFDTLQFDRVQPMYVFLKQNPYLPILDVDARISQRQRLLDEMSPDVVAAMLRDLNQKKESARQNIVLLSDQYPGWQPGG